MVISYAKYQETWLLELQSLDDEMFDLSKYMEISFYWKPRLANQAINGTCTWNWAKKMIH